MSDMVPEVLNAALDSLFTPKEPGELEYQGDDGLLYCRNCHTPVQCRVKLWGRDKIVPCLCRCQQEAMAEKKRQDELVERQRKIRQLKATGIQEKHLLEWNFAVAEDNKDIQMAKRYVEQWKKVKAENLGLLLWGDVGTGKSFVAACIANALLEQGIPVLMTNFSKILNQMGAMYSEERYRYIASFSNYSLLILDDLGIERSTEYTMDFQVTPHQLRHTYITNLIYASVDPKTVQYLAGHENSKVTMDIYAKVKYNKPAQLHGVINRAIDTSKKD